ncbi:MAG: hypothetical protein M0P73_06865 [Syntrophobacterales bacterium]|jgi:hypothetical protein|nr:hypothetical protein [Syntrophobacterales bacterium]
MNFHLEYHWLYLALAGLVILWGISLLAVRLWTRRQVIKTLMAEEDLEAVGIVLPNPRPEDQAALDLITSYRKRYLLKLWPGTEISFKAINELSQELIKEIAGIYYPDEDHPEFKASLADLVALHNRVGARLAAWLNTMPIRPFKDVELATVLRYHEMYQSLKSHWGYAFIKEYHLDRVVRWGWTAYNYANPWHWGRKAAYHGGKEVVARLLMARIADLVGEEAVHIYGRRRDEPNDKRRGRASAGAD